MAKVDKTAAIVGALAGLGLAELVRNRAAPAPTPTVRRARPAAPPPPPRYPALSPERVHRMVVDWGMAPELFHGRARRWAAEARARNGTRQASLSPAPTTDLVVVEDGLQALLERYIAAVPSACHFYAICPGDTPQTIGKAVLHQVGGVEPAPELVDEYVWCFSAASYNLQRYGSRSTSNSYPARWIVPGLGLGLRAAFLPRNADAIDLLAHGRAVPRTVDERGVRVVDDACHYGTLWLPAVCPDELASRVVTCAPLPHPDGSVSLEPPPALLAQLEAA